jgi:hypothetical protein
MTRTGAGGGGVRAVRTAGAIEPGVVPGCRGRRLMRSPPRQLSAAHETQPAPPGSAADRSPRVSSYWYSPIAAVLRLRRRPPSADAPGCASWSRGSSADARTRADPSTIGRLGRLRQDPALQIALAWCPVPGIRFPRGRRHAGRSRPSSCACVSSRPSDTASPRDPCRDPGRGRFRGTNGPATPRCTSRGRSALMRWHWTGLGRGCTTPRCRVLGPALHCTPHPDRDPTPAARA